MDNQLTERIVASFEVPGVRLFVAADPDRLLTAEEPAATLLARHIAMLPFESPVEFRYLYETQYRHSGGTLVVRTASDTSCVPSDVLSRARVVRFDLSTFFPHLAVDVLRQIPFAVLARLYEAQEPQSADLAVHETARVVAEKGYGISAESVSSDESLYASLLRLHLDGGVLPDCVAKYVVGVWRRNTRFAGVPLERLVRDRSAFLEYLQGHWDAWASSVLGSRLAGSTVADAVLVDAYGQDTSSSPAPLIPWESLAVRTLIDDYFDMGLLEPVRSVSRGDIPEWAACGLIIDESEYVLRRVDKLAAILQDDAQPWNVSIWGTVARDLGSLLARYYLMHVRNGAPDSDVRTLLTNTNERFSRWLRTNYDASLSLPYVPYPSSVHQIAPYLATMRKDRMALVVMDGMNWWQWHIIARGLEQHGLAVDVVSSALACIPTITSISRSTIFAGRLPRSFFRLGTGPGELALWQGFWGDNGLAPEHAALHVVGPTSTLQSSLERAKPSFVRAFAAVVPKVDELIHGIGLTPGLLAAAVQSWATDDELSRYLRGLLDADYDVYVTADHGNTMARGIGVNSSGVLAEDNGRRARIFESSTLRDSFVEQRSGIAEAWHSASLPPDVNAALCLGDGAFAPENQMLNCHGGISLLEVMVPFAHISGGNL
jgi:hypothetical protein